MGGGVGGGGVGKQKGKKDRKGKEVRDGRERKRVEGCLIAEFETEPDVRIKGEGEYGDGNEENSHGGLRGMEVTGDIINEHNLQVTHKHVLDRKKNQTHICTIPVRILKIPFKMQP